jgi:hypothetical protein
MKISDRRIPRWPQGAGEKREPLKRRSAERTSRGLLLGPRGAVDHIEGLAVKEVEFRQWLIAPERFCARGQEFGGTPRRAAPDKFLAIALSPEPLHARWSPGNGRGREVSGTPCAALACGDGVVSPGGPNCAWTFSNEGTALAV